MFRFASVVLLCAGLTACGGDGAQQDSAGARKLLGGSAPSSAAAAVSVKQFPGLREDYTISAGAASMTVTSKAGAQVAVPADSTLRFDDCSLVFGTGSAAARILRLYQAAFNRAPDAAGLSYWAPLLEQGASLDTIATGFATSSEYQALYGKSPGAQATVDNLYRNVLRREGDAAGVAYWLGVLTQGRATVAQVLVSFSESQENLDGTRAAMSQGVVLYEPGVNYTPVARPGASQEVLVGTEVRLDGSASSAARKVSYRWTLSSKPEGSKAGLSDADSAAPAFTADLAGTYGLTLVVGDGASFSSQASLQVTAKTIPSVWKADAGKVPASGNYVYLQGTEGDAIVGNRSYLYTQSDAAFSLSAHSNVADVWLKRSYSTWERENWGGLFQLPGKGTRLVPGYYGDLSGLPMGEGTAGAFRWDNPDGKCAAPAGWFVIDKVRYSGSELAAIDLRFEQRCDGAPGVLHGQIHWDASDTTNVPLPVLPMPAGLWTPTASAPSGNYVYLESVAGDTVGLGKTYLYTHAGGTAVTVSGTLFSVNVNDGPSGDKWTGQLAAMAALRELKPGYYGGLSRYPYHKAAWGGIDWGGMGRGCTSAPDAGWFAIDGITYSFGKVKTLDVRFENRCGAGAAPLRGKIHWVF
ncbi:DUF4214 domain-containing protein [Pseudoduganella aquatica]|uniref:DUF4214 domain-containing protein n=1 Tax=Pseudoduganella aquatica TaxID=2660641 RepID=UPI001E326071|nr:DUF4214 domain-containing protein [Pseudoduganella aquatica]